MVGFLYHQAGTTKQDLIDGFNTSKKLVYRGSHKLKSI